MSLYKIFEGEYRKIVASCVTFNGNSSQRRIAKRQKMRELKKEHQSNVIAINFYGAWDFLLINEGE